METYQKKNVAIKFVNFSESDEFQKQKLIANPTFDVHKFKDRKKTKFELSAIYEANSAFREVFEQFGLDDLFSEVSADIIHISGKTYFNKKLKSSVQTCYTYGKLLSFFSYGHIYVCRENNKADFIINLTHEMAHNLSFYMIKVLRTAKKLRLFVLQTGLQKSQYGDKGTSVVNHFSGLNEAVTEIMAKYARQIIVRDSELLSESEKKNIITYYSAYLNQIEVVNNFIAKSGVARPIAIKFLLQAYITGNSSLINRTKLNPKKTNLIKRMDPSPESGKTSLKLIGQI